MFFPRSEPNGSFGQPQKSTDTQGGFPQKKTGFECLPWGSQKTEPWLQTSDVLPFCDVSGSTDELEKNERKPKILLNSPSEIYINSKIVDPMVDPPQKRTPNACG